MLKTKIPFLTFFIIFFYSQNTHRILTEHLFTISEKLREKPIQYNWYLLFVLFLTYSCHGNLEIKKTKWFKTNKSNFLFFFSGNQNKKLLTKCILLQNFHKSIYFFVIFLKRFEGCKQLQKLEIKIIDY